MALVNFSTEQVPEPHPCVIMSFKLLYSVSLVGRMSVVITDDYAYWVYFANVCGGVQCTHTLLVVHRFGVLKTVFIDKKLRLTKRYLLFRALE